ncbi:hypothetical protein B0H19DRAFT_1072654 [Mycena capillaripes]|nr:hypothetical protein B0H19DRAFT_1072654 [Mycena capillaripes]
MAQIPLPFILFSLVMGFTPSPWCISEGEEESPAVQENLIGVNICRIGGMRGSLLGGACGKGPLRQLPEVHAGCKVVGMCSVEEWCKRAKRCGGILRGAVTTLGNINSRLGLVGESEESSQSDKEYTKDRQKTGQDSLHLGTSPALCLLFGYSLSLLRLCLILTCKADAFNTYISRMCWFSPPVLDGRREIDLTLGWKEPLDDRELTSEPSAESSNEELPTAEEDLISLMLATMDIGFYRLRERSTEKPSWKNVGSQRKFCARHFAL